MPTIDTFENRLRLEELVAIHYLGIDTGDLELATRMMREDVRFSFPAFGLVFESRDATKAGLAGVRDKLPPVSRHRPAGFRFSSPDERTLRAFFTTHIMSCLDGTVHAIGDITVDAVQAKGGVRLVVKAWEVQVIFFRGVISGGGPVGGPSKATG